MTKYLVFKNQPDSGQANVPGSREEMACTIAKVVSQQPQPKDFYIAYPLENPHSTWESLKETAKFSVEIDDERAALWENEFLPLADLAENINEAIGDAYGAIVDAAQAFDHACEKSKNFQDFKVLDDIGMDRAFDNLENGSSYEVAARAEEIFEVESFHHYHA
jgi:hypothetical protein